MRLRTRFILALVIAVTLPTAVVASLVGRELLAGWREQTVHAQQRETDAVAFAVETYLRRAVEIVATTAERPALRRGLARGTTRLPREAMEGLNARALGFEVLFVVDAHGTMRFNDLDPSLVGQDFSTRDYYRGVLRTGRPYVSAPFIGRAAREPVVAVAAPIRDQGGQLLGLLAGDVPLRALNGLVGEARSDGGLMLAGADGTILAHPEADRLMQPAGTANPAIARALRGEAGAIEWTDAHGERQLSAFSPITPLGWAVVQTQSLAAVSAPLWRAGRRVLTFALAALGLAALGGILLAAGLARPIVGLREGVRRLAGGDLGTRLHLRRRDELGDLGRDIDTMAAQLETKVAELDRRMRELALLQAIDRWILAGTPVPEFVQRAMEEFGRLADARSCLLVAPAGEDGSLQLLAAHSADREELSRYFAELRPLGSEGPAGLALATRAPVASPDIAADERWGRLREAFLARGLRAALAVPLVAAEELLGAVLLTYPTPRQFPDEELQRLQRFAGQLAIAFQQARLRAAAAARVRAEEASRVKSLFLANMSHEIRTPLNSILGFGHLLQMDTFGPLSAKQRGYVGHIQEAGQHLLALINDILDLSKAEAGQFTLSPEGVPVGPTLEAAVLLAKGLAAQKRVRLRLDVEDGLDTVWADPVRLKQILYNLLSNAVKFTPQGGQVTVTARQAARGLEIAVRDTGIGIKAEDLPRLFTEFSQLGPQRHEGTGLGLALTKRLVELHGGTIGVESEPARGSTFTVTLPAPPPAEAARTVGSAVASLASDHLARTT